MKGAGVVDRDHLEISPAGIVIEVAAVPLMTRTATDSTSPIRTAPRPTRFSLAANYDPELVPALSAYPIDEVYGRFPTDGISSGRPHYLATPLSEADLRHYVRLLDHHGIAFNYLLNGACFGNHEWTRPWQKRVTALLTKLGDMGVRRVTVSTPFLLELIKRRFPKLKVRVGIYAQVDTPRRARFWEDLGADAIVLESFSINRNFPRLKAIRQAVRCDLELIANHVCLMNWACLEKMDTNSGGFDVV